MNLAPGQSLGSYHILAPLGAGGMGEVWRATDTKLGRDVAIKVLPAEVARDAERLSRFRREAHLLAALNHPNVAAIHGLEEEGAQPFLVLELVEGEDLALRLKSGPLPVEEALEIARQIAEALEEAHAKGIVHRDLKPANVKLTPDGRVKVLDFGLAKAYAGESGTASSADVSQSPTLARSGTLAGVILGTAAYMPPEQASGKAVDKRADIWAFGVVLFEMLTGAPLFTGETASEILAAVIKEEPSWERLPSACPPAIAKLLRRCLRKRPRERLQDIGDARLELTDAIAGVSEGLALGKTDPGATQAVEQRRRIRERGAWAAAVLASAGLAGLLALPHIGKVPAGAQAAHFVLEMPEGAILSGFNPVAVSPDGRSVVFAAVPPGGIQSVLYIRPLDSPGSRPLAGTEGAESPFWSPDSGSVAFFAASELRKIGLLGGGAQKVCALPTGVAIVGGTWSPTGTIVFASGPQGGVRLLSTPANGGEAKLLAAPDRTRGEAGYFWPQFLPDGRRLFYAVGGQRPETGGWHVAALETPGERRLIPAQGGRLTYAPPGGLLFARGNSLLAQGFDAKALRPMGEQVTLTQTLDSFEFVPEWGWFSASANGVLAYVARGDNNRQLQWLDRKGLRLGAVGKPAVYGQIAMAPDGKRLAVEMPDAEGSYDLWVIELARGIASRVTFDPASERDPVWSPDGRELVFAVERAAGRRDLLRKNLLANEPPALLLESSVLIYPKSWSTDGRYLAYVTESQGKQAAWALPLKGDGKPEALLDTGFLVDGTKISPDGRWLAYISQESGRWEVYIQPFRRAGERLRVSPEGGGQPKWRGDGKELFYLSLDGRMMAVDVRAGEATVEVGLPGALFEAGRFFPDYDDYAVTADGQRFLMKVLPEKDATRRIHVIVNWPSLIP